MTEVIQKMYKKQGIRYVFFGGCTTLVNLVSFAVLRSRYFNVNMTAANAFSILLAILFAYVVNRQFVFESRTAGAPAVMREFASFVGMRLSTMFIEIFGVAFMSCLWGIPEMWAKLAVQFVVLALNFVFSKWFVFSDREKTLVNPVKRRCCLFGFLIPVAVIFIAFAVNGVFPFGDRGVLIIDSLHQYLPFFTEFHEKLKEGSSFRYSFGGGLGFNFWATYAYYLASPLNFLIALVPKRNVMDAMAYLIILKIGLCGLTSAWYFSTRSRGKTYIPVVFSVMFSLSSFIIGYYFNIMWLDSIAMLPLVMMGIERIIRGERGRLYGVSLFYALYCNYYIGFMLCLFSCLYFLVTWISAKQISVKKVLLSCVNFGWHSLFAGGMAAVVLVPAFVALGVTESAENSFPQKIQLFVENLSQLTSQFAFCEPINIANDQIGVNAFCGTAALILGLLFLLDRRIRLRERIAKTALLVLLYASFDVNILNYIWHGFHVQNGLPNRFAFIYIFFLLVLAFDAWRHLKTFSAGRLLLASGAALGFAGYAAYSGLGERELYTYVLTLTLLLLYSLLLLLYRTGMLKKGMFRLTFHGVILLEMVSYGIFGVCCNGTVGRSTYLDEQKAYEKMVWRQEAISATMTPFFRSEIDSNRMRNENMFLGADGVVLFSSTMPASTVDLCKSLGIEARTNKNGYNGYTKLMNDVFGVKYVISGRDGESLYQMDKIDREEEMTLYRNLNALSLGFLTNSSIKDWDTSSREHFEVQNEFVTLATGSEGIFHRREVLEIEEGRTYQIILPAGKQVYLDMTEAVEKLEVTTPEYSKTYETYTDHLYDLGCVDAITYATVTCTYKENQEGPVVAEVWECSQEDYERVHEILKSRQMQALEVRDGYVNGILKADTDGTLLFSIPYDKGWKVLVDQKEVQTYPVGQALMGLDVSAGSHTVELDYTPPGMWLGTAISLLCIVLYVLGMNMEERLRKGREVQCGQQADEDVQGAWELQAEDETGEWELEEDEAREQEPEEDETCEQESEKNEACEQEPEEDEDREYLAAWDESLKKGEQQDGD